MRLNIFKANKKNECEASSAKGLNELDFKNVFLMLTSAVWGGLDKGAACNQSLGGRLVHSLSWQAITNILGRICTFAIAIIQARILGKAGYGELGMVLSTLSMFGLVSGAAGGSTCTKYIAETRKSDPYRAGRIAALSVTITLLVSLLPVLAMFFLGPFLSVNILHAPQLLGSLWLGSVALSFIALAGTASGMLSGLQEFKIDGQLRLAQVVVWLPLTSWLTPRMEVFGAMLAYTLSQAVGFAAYVVVTSHVFRRVGFELRFRNMWSESYVLVRFSLPLLLHGVLVIPTVWICNAILARQPNGYAALGGYTAALQFRTVVLQFPILIQGVVWPTLAELYGEHKLNKLASLYQNTFEVLWAMGLIAALPMIAFGGVIMGVFGRSFTADRGIMDLVMAITSVSLLGGFSGSLLQVLDKTWPALWVNVAYSVVSMSCTLALVPRFGAYGLANAFVISTFVQAILLLLFVRSFFPLLHRLRNFGFVGLSIVLCLALQMFTQSIPWLSIRLLALLACLGFVCRLGLVRPCSNLFRSMLVAKE